MILSGPLEVKKSTRGSVREHNRRFIARDVQERSRFVHGKEGTDQTLVYECVSPKSLGGVRKSTPYPLATSEDSTIYDLQSMPTSLVVAHTRVTMVSSECASHRVWPILGTLAYRSDIQSM
jgi:hypothetical protein